MGLVVVLVVMLMVGYLGWFYGRLHEAQVEYQQEQLDEAAFRWASQHGRLPTVTKYIDPETGEEIHY